MTIDDFTPVRPEISLESILVYSVLTFLIGICITPCFVQFLKKNKIGKQLRVEAVDGGEATIFRHFHQKKRGTPTMGGLLIWGSILFTVVFSRILSYIGVVEHSLLQRGQVYIPLFTLVSLGILGAVDDYWSILGFGKKKGGLDVLPKIIFLLLVSGFCGFWFYARLGYDTIHMPFYGDLYINGWYIPFFMFVLIGTANAVNITDGLDGLAGGLLVIAFIAFGTLAYLEGLYILAGFCGIIVAAVSAFLWNNVPPALFFMGDTGSLALGGTLAVIAMMIDQVLVLPIIGIIFVVEMFSVIAQLLSKKLRNGKRILKAAPIHHHFEALGWGESKVTMRLWIIGGFCAFLGVIVGVIG
ncbi:phospho-N-acetylmuramoyl-pentapeptide-transferase [Candidatus Peribacteria bacterium]|jgi:phospho-N-acetylmuramoyl-pentapeptide-transferase|nr:phospho-N-acetylmuramoyl-pentapeptide-transferase [Candidatus Peribacteria bacterium]MBT4020918.1 phospho-N-acetylmuramoyl-pentapeptide-transferase [Candidatus Peribacteria bacterium]MBT4240476.1 phospho-N-acetylmuramoyl-pentapeptide-transferase [Candidatus Peribacteria bacterium]MBT4474360.1 phospho-N-acetylmuramoyl-pentapeptide-transferase [Candidatus Peribacteria bacterium]